MSAQLPQQQVSSIVEAMESALDRVIDHLAGACTVDGRIDEARVNNYQVAALDIAFVSSAVSAARELVEVGASDEFNASLALACAADVAVDFRSRVDGRSSIWGIEASRMFADVASAIDAGRDLKFLETLGERVIQLGQAGSRKLPEDLEMVRQTFRRFAEAEVMPIAEAIHRNDEDIPEYIIAGLAKLGCFGLSIPPEFGGLAEHGDDALVSMVLVTEELSRGSLGLAGSLITRPEIVSAAVLHGGTLEQKQRWLPRISSGERMCGIAVTEPNFGSDVAGIMTTAVRDGDDWVLNGVKTWSTFAGRAEYLLVLARTDPNRAIGHRGLSLFVVEKPARSGQEWALTQDAGGKMEARAIPTIGYRGMHSFEVSLSSWRVPHANLIGEDAGIGRGFYLQMQAFANARLQTAARAQGVMQAALEHAAAYARERSIFGQSLADFQLTRVKVARMASLLASCRGLTMSSAESLARGDTDAGLKASQAKQLACRAAEWVTREAQQLHGGYGYAEEFTVSRLFVDARVLAIFEGSDEVLGLKVIARQLLARATAVEAP